MSIEIRNHPIEKRDGERWYVVYTRRGQERWASQNMNRQGFRVFDPRMQCTSASTQTPARPLFPSYTFVAFDRLRQRWRSINGTYGVRCLVAFGDDPEPVPIGIVEGLIMNADADGVLTACDESPAFLEGQSVAFLEGPLKSQIGKIIKLESGARVKLLLDIMAVGVTISIPAEAVTKY